MDAGIHFCDFEYCFGLQLAIARDLRYQRGASLHCLVVNICVEGDSISVEHLDNGRFLEDILLKEKSL